MDATSSRWNEVTPSAFEHERRALDDIRGRLPDEHPYLAWSNFTFISNHGHIREVDLLLLTPAGLHLVEIKNLHGRLTNRGQVWVLNGGAGRDPFDNPIMLANSKAKELASLLKQEALRDRRVRVPFLREAVFLAEPDMACELDERQRQRVYGPGRGRNDLTSIDEGLIHAAARSEIDADLARVLPMLMKRIGIEPNRRRVAVGPWELERPPMEDGPTWQDFHASRSDVPGDHHRRVRIYLFQKQTTAEMRASVQHAAQREYAAAQGIDHPGLLVPDDLMEHELGPALLIDQRRDAQRLDHWMARNGAELDLAARLALVRQLAEAVRYAHEHRLVHRALSPRAIVVEDHGATPRLRVGEWQVAARGLSSSRSAQRIEPTSHAGSHVEAAAQGYLAPDFTTVADGTVAIDVFGVGAVAHLVLTGSPPSTTRQELFERLARENGFRPCTDAPELPADVDDLIAAATARQVSARIGDLDEFLDLLREIEASLPGADGGSDPLDARQGDGLPEGYRVLRVLGSGASSTGILVERHGLESVLKVGREIGAEERLEAEAIVLHDLRHDHVVALRQGMFPLAGRPAIELSHAGDETVAHVLAREGALDGDALEALGLQLLDAIAYLHGHDTLHRDVKPDNLGLHRHPRRGLQLTLFDFSLAGTSTKDVLTGTFGYRDPMLGTGSRATFDEAADLYSVAATLHEMAAAEVPVWGDDGTHPAFVDEATLSTDCFEPAHRDGLVAFFRQALHREAGRRYPSAPAMAAAWGAVFRGPPSRPDPVEIDVVTLDPARLAVHVDFLAELRRLGGDVRSGVLDAVRSFPRRLPALVAPSGAADPWMRTLAVTGSHSGVVLAPEHGDRYLLLQVLPHGDASAWAKKHAASVNDVSGGFELRDAVELDRLEAELEAAVHDAPALLFSGVDDADLARLGIDAQVRSMARTLGDEATLRTLQPFLPEEQFSVLLALAAGRTPDEVWTDLVAPRAAGATVDGSDRETAIDRTQGKLLRVDDVELADYLDRPISAWRTFLHSSQERISYRPTYWGSAQVTGGPGTGKTVAALHRVKFLAQRKPLPPKSILLTTFTNTLEAALERDLHLLDLAPDELEAVQVVNIDAWTRSVVAEAHGAVNIVKPADSRKRWQRAADRAGVSESPTFLEAEYHNVVLAQNVETEDGYLSCLRHGRGRPVRQAERRTLWNAMALYAQGLAGDRLWTWNGVAAAAAELLAQREKPAFLHVVVDEVQDLHPAKLRTIRAATRRGPDDIFLTGDPHQRIYSNRVSLKQVGITVASRSYKLKINYRTSAEILDWALGVLGEGEHEGFDGSRDTFSEYRASFHGQPPVLAGASSTADEDAALVESVRTWHAQGIAWDDIAVAARTNAVRQRATSALTAAGVPVQDADATACGVVSATLHGMKGLEFRAVAIVGVEGMPNKQAITPESQDPTLHEQDLQQERNLLFVAATRAREQLRVSWTGDSSRFLP